MGTSNGMNRGHNTAKGGGHADSSSRFKKKDNFFPDDDYGDGTAVVAKNGRGKSEKGERGARMNPMVLETWINETL